MTTIKLKNGSGAPTSGDLAQGEPALDLTNKRLYTEDSGGTVIEVGTNPGTDVTFADNRKAIFGAGSDLQIYHDGSNSYVSDQGTGSLFITGASNMYLQNGSSETFLDATTNGSVRLFYDNSLKLETTSTGIDVTGTVVSNGLTLENNAEYLKVTNSSGSATRAFGVNSANNLYIGGIDADIGPILFVDNGATLATLGPTGIDVTGTVVSDGVQSTDGDIKVTTSGSFVGFNSQRAGVPSSGGYQLGRLNFDAYSTGTTFVSGASIQSFSDGAAWTSSSTPAYLSLQTTPSGSTSLKERLKIANNGDISFYEDTGTTAKLFWDASAESLGIGTSSPDSALVVQGGQGTYAQIKDGTVTTLLQARGQDSIGVVGTLSNHGFGFFTNSTERMRIDSSGNLLVGKTYTAASIAGQELRAGGYTAFTRSGGNPLELNRLTSDGTIVNFSKDGTSVGSIATTSSRLSIGSNDVGLFFDSTNERFTPIDQTNQTDRDAAIDLGYASSRFKDLHLSNGINLGGNSAEILEARTETGFVKLTASHSGGGSNSAGFIFRTRNGTAGTNEKMRLTKEGNLLVGTTDSTPNGLSISGAIVAFNDGTRYAISLATNTSATSTAAAISNTNGLVGTITTSGSSTAYNTSSDQRLKENIVDAPSASEDIDAIQVRSFDWKADGSHQKYGMVAQELQSVAPEAVSEGATEEDMMGVDYSKLVPMLVKEIQSLRARVAQLEGEA
jgi:hypothetical protein